MDTISTLIEVNTYMSNYLPFVNVADTYKRGKHQKPKKNNKKNNKAEIKDGMTISDLKERLEKAKSKLKQQSKPKKPAEDKELKEGEEKKQKKPYELVRWFRLNNK